jgi:hypothetical protein
MPKMIGKYECNTKNTIAVTVQKIKKSQFTIALKHSKEPGTLIPHTNKQKNANKNKKAKK